jgi:hypothetical protein
VTPFAQIWPADTSSQSKYPHNAWDIDSPASVCREVVKQRAKAADTRPDVSRA